MRSRYGCVSWLGLAVVGGLVGCAAQDELNVSSTGPHETFEQWRSRQVYDAAQQRWIVEGDMPFYDEDAMYEYWAEQQDEALSISSYGGVDNKWSTGSGTTLTYCVSDHFNDTNPWGANKTDAVNAMLAASDEWKRRANVTFTYLPQYDSSCDPLLGNVTFAVVWDPTATPPQNAAAISFFPNTFAPSRFLTAYKGFFSLPGDNEHKMRVFGHELGHSLGFMHEFSRVDADADCAADTTSNQRTLTTYDRKSIMQYSCTAGMTPSWTRLDTDGVQQIYGAPLVYSQDILWRDSDGTIAIWTMSGGANQGSTFFSNPGSSLVMSGTADFDGDRKSDILFRDSSTGVVTIWKMKGTAHESTYTFATPGSSWRIDGTGDFDRDGMNDILWRNTSTGAVMIWFMDSTQTYKQTMVRTATTLATTPGLDWQIKATGDFDGDGKSDILWRGSDGSTAIWLMNGSTITSQVYPGTVGLDWTIAGTGDFDGNAKSDILWRGSDGTVAIWFMNGGTHVSTAYPGAPGLDWQIMGTGNYNTDSDSDILWRDSDGTVAIWFMNGGTNAAQAYPTGSPLTDWVIKGVGQFKTFVQ